MICTGSNIVCLETRDSSGFEQDASTVPIIFDDGRVRQSIDLETRLETVETAPNKTISISCASEGMVRTAANLDNTLVLKGVDNGGVKDNSLVISSTLLNSGFAVAVQAPAVNFSRFMNCERVE